MSERRSFGKINGQKKESTYSTYIRMGRLIGGEVSAARKGGSGNERRRKGR